MSFDVQLTITGIQKAQRANSRMIAKLKARDTPARAIKATMPILHRHAVGATHIDTGAYKAAHRVKVKMQRGLSIGRLFVDPAARNPRSGVPPYEYSQYEERRGGSHATYRRTFQEAGPKALAAGGAVFARNIIGGLR